MVLGGYVLLAVLCLQQCNAFIRPIPTFSRNFKTNLNCEGQEGPFEDVEPLVEQEQEQLPTVDQGNTTAPIDAKSEAVRAKEVELTKKIAELENTLRSERNRLAISKDRLSETGKNGFFIVQAQVADFLKRRDTDQKNRVRNNKKEFVNKMLPIVDAFRMAPIDVPGDSEKEKTMHTTMGALLNGIVIAIEKFGYKEYMSAAGEKLDAVKHQIAAVEEDGTEGLIIRCVRPGMLDAEGEVVRRALVVASGTAGSEDASQGEGAEEDVESEEDA